MKQIRFMCFILAITLASDFYVHAQEHRLPVIDMHMHAEDSIWATHRLCFPQPCAGLPTKIKDAKRLRPASLEQMRKYNVVLAVISGMRDDVLPWTEGMEDKFQTGLLFNRPDDIAYSELRQLLESGRVQVLGELALQYEAIPIDDPSVDPMLALAHRLDIPVHVHIAGLGGTPDFPVHLGNPLRVARVLCRHFYYSSRNPT